VRDESEKHVIKEQELMTSVGWFTAALCALSVAQTSMAQQGPVQIVGLVELSGTGATSGTNFDNGVKLAVKEINATGGILGRKIEYTSNDTQSQPQTSKALAQKAVDQGAYVVMGPVFSGSIIVSMVETLPPASAK
jgi:branched-chain amino acid transport system substrate-binding protein